MVSSIIGFCDPIKKTKSQIFLQPVQNQTAATSVEGKYSEIIYNNIKQCYFTIILHNTF